MSNETDLPKSGQESGERSIGGIPVRTSTGMFEVAMMLGGKPIIMEIKPDVRAQYLEYLSEQNEHVGNLIGMKKTWVQERKAKLQNMTRLQRFFSWEPVETDGLEQDIQELEAKRRDLSAATLELQSGRVDRLRYILCKNIDVELILSGPFRMGDVHGDNVAREAVLTGIKHAQLLSHIDPDTARDYIAQFEKRKSSVVPWYARGDPDNWWEEGRESDQKTEE